MPTGFGTTSTVASITTPKVPPPPPRNAQNRSVFWHALATRSSPSGVTIRNWTTLSTPIPYLFERIECPPPFKQMTPAKREEEGVKDCAVLCQIYAVFLCVLKRTCNQPPAAPTVFPLPPIKVILFASANW